MDKFDFLEIQTKDSLLLQKEWINLAAKETDKGLEIGEHSVVEKWEKEIQNNLGLIVAKQSKNILEIGYGLGMATEGIRKRNPNEHHIIEAHPKIALTALKQFLKNETVIITTDFWENIINTLPLNYYSGILFDAYPLSGLTTFSNPTIQMLNPVKEHQEELNGILKKGGTFSFIDFTCNITNTQFFKRLFVKNSFLIHKFNISIPKDCSYARGNSAHIIEIIKESNHLFRI